MLCNSSGTNFPTTPLVNSKVWRSTLPAVISQAMQHPWMPGAIIICYTPYIDLLAQAKYSVLILLWCGNGAEPNTLMWLCGPPKPYLPNVIYSWKFLLNKNFTSYLCIAQIFGGINVFTNAGNVAISVVKLVKILHWWKCPATCIICIYISKVHLGLERTLHIIVPHNQI